MSLAAMLFVKYLGHVPASRPKRGRTAARPGPSSTAAQVLEALAERAWDDGTNAYPAAEMIAIMTRLSERTVRDTIDLLHDEGCIRPGDPAVLAARIKRADQRPQTWDLNLHRRHPGPCGRDLCGWTRTAYRDDLTPKQLERIWRAVPLLAPHVEEILTALAEGAEHAAEAREVLARLPHNAAPFAPRGADGVQTAQHGVQTAHSPDAPGARNAAPFAPEPYEPSLEPLFPTDEVVTPDGATERATLDEQFAQWWAVYPKKVGKQDARRAWDRARRRVDVDTLLAGARRFAADPNLPADKQYIPYPEKWLNRGGWDDEPLPARGDVPPRQGTGDGSVPRGWEFMYARPASDAELRDRALNPHLYQRPA